MKRILTLALCSISLNSFASDDLSKKLEALSIPSEKVTPLLTEDELIAVNGRYSSLNKRHEVTFSGANNFTADSHMETKQISATYRFHINSNWSIGARYSEYENKLSGAGEKLFDEQKILPDADFAIKSSEGFVNYNTVYGKLRLTKSTIVYFDHYVSLGYGTVALGNGEAQTYIGDTGLAFWIGKHASLRTGLRNEFYRQKKLNGPENVHNGMGYIEFGYLFGGTKI